MAQERCEEKRAAFAEQIALVPLERLVFLDECGFGLNLCQLYGWTIGGGRCVERVPFHLQRGQAHSVVGALSLPSLDCPSGLRALWQKSGTWTRDSFEAFLQDGLLPVLPSGSVLVLDNARIHHGGNIKALVEQAGCSLLYLPPYSPDFNPIEMLWSWLKNHVRALAPRDKEQRWSAIQNTADALPHHFATQWFKNVRLRLPELL
ncbi:MAG: IS630 family transposase [Armatimonadetes bacterium]|nr:IS630 family transposase [Armatimonadota bacterium]